MRRITVLFALFAATQMMATADFLVWENPRIKVPSKVVINASPFDLQDVRLLDGPFLDAMLRDQKYLLGIDSDRLLHMFRVTAGLPPPARPSGRREAPDGVLLGRRRRHVPS